MTAEPTTAPVSTPDAQRPATKHRRDWLVPAGLIALSLVPALAGGVRLAEVTGGAELTADNARFLQSPIPVVSHIVTVTIYCVLGAFQFSRGFRARHRRWHRAAGRLLIPAGLVSAISGLWMTQFYDLPPMDGAVLYWTRWIVGLAMIAAIYLGVRELLRRNFRAHGAWMIRAYALGLGAGTQVFTSLPLLALPDAGGMTGRAISMAAGWVINVVIAERIIRRRT